TPMVIKRQAMGVAALDPSYGGGIGRIAGQVDESSGASSALQVPRQDKARAGWLTPGKTRIMHKSRMGSL
ncbi:MAG: hypothetical protein WKF61_12050, partial [Luteimonas sp.]